MANPISVLLVAESHLSYLPSLKKMLPASTYTLAISAPGPELVTQVSATAPAIILVDGQLAEPFAVAARLRDNGLSTPLVFLLPPNTIWQTFAADQITLTGVYSMTRPLTAQILQTKIATLAGRQTSQPDSTSFSAEHTNFRALVEASPIATFVIQKNKNRYFNPAAVALCEVTPQALLQMDFCEIIYPGEREAIEQKIEIWQQSAVTEVQYQTRILTGAGRTHWVNLTLKRLEFEGQPALLGTMIDITTLKQSERTLTLETLLTRQLKNSGVLSENLDIILSNILQVTEFDSGSIHLFNDKTGQITDLTPSSHRGLSERAVTALECLMLAEDCRVQVMQGQSIYWTVDEMPLDRKTALAAEGLQHIAIIPVVSQNVVVGVLNLATRSSLPISINNRQIVESIATNQLGELITRLELERELLESEARYRRIIENTEEGIWLLDADNRTTFANSKMAEMLGCSIEEMQGKSWLAFMDDVDQQTIAKNFQQQVGITDQQDFLFKRNDGKSIWVTINATPLFDSGGEYIGALGIIKDVTARHEAEEARYKEALRFKTLFTSAPIGAALLDDKGKLLLSNMALQQMMGYSAEELSKMAFTEFTHPDDVDTDWQLFQGMVNGTYDSYQLGKRYIHKNGNLVWGELSVAAIRNALGEIEYLLGMVQDVTYQKEAKQALQKSEARYRKLAETAQDIILIHDLTGQIHYVNSAATQILGYTIAQLQQMNVVDLIHPDWRSRMPWPQDKQSVANSQAEYDENFNDRYDIEAVTETGQIISLEVNASVFNDVDEQAMIMLLARNVTQRKRAEAETELLYSTSQSLNRATTNLDLLAALVQPAQLFDVSTAGLFYTLSNTIGTSVTYEVVALWGQPQKPLPSLQIGDFMPMTDEQVAALQPQAVANTPLLITDYRHDKRVGKPLRQMMSQDKQETLALLPFAHYSDKNWLGFVFFTWPTAHKFSRHEERMYVTLINMATPIVGRQQLLQALKEEQALLTQRVEERTADLSRANAELARAARLKDEFLANMSHELRTPLNAILGQSEILQEQLLGPLNDKQHKSLHTVIESSHHLLSLINDILDLSKIEADKIRLTTDRVVVQDVCNASLRMIREQAHKKGVKINSQFDSSVTEIEADMRRLKQILVNLLSNAVKFTPENGTIGLTVEGNSALEVVYFTVWDTGIGIDSEEIGQLFKPFVQLDSSLSRAYDGTGLGLALVSRLTEMHGGSVSVKSEKGVGSRFIISLPWRTTKTQPSAPQTPPTPPAALKQAVSSAGVAQSLILLAEDNEISIETISQYLQANNFRIITARNGLEATQLAAEKEPDLILMDIQMPKMDGLTATKRIRQNSNLKDTPIIALTALAMPGDRARCLEAGANQYFSKPVSLKRLVESINTMLQNNGS